MHTCMVHKVVETVEYSIIQVPKKWILTWSGKLTVQIYFKINLYHWFIFSEYISMYLTLFVLYLRFNYHMVLSYRVPAWFNYCTRRNFNFRLRAKYFSQESISQPTPSPATAAAPLATARGSRPTPMTATSPTPTSRPTAPPPRAGPESSRTTTRKSTSPTSGSLPTTPIQTVTSCRSRATPRIPIREVKGLRATERMAMGCPLSLAATVMMQI